MLIRKYNNNAQLAILTKALEMNLKEMALVQELFYHLSHQTTILSHLTAQLVLMEPPSHANLKTKAML